MSWELYIEKSKERPLRPLYLKSLGFLQSLKSTPRVAVDLGCGSGVETQDLLQKGWEVFAYDKEEAACRSVDALVSPSERDRLHLENTAFENIESLPRNQLVFAYHSLPFCDVDHFDRMMKMIADSIISGGYFVASFFGNNDQWVREDKTLGMTVTEIEYHFDGFEFLHLEEKDQLGVTLLSGPKHWHTIEVIARKRMNL